MPAVRPDTIAVNVVVVFVTDVEIAANDVEAATVDAPETAKPRLPLEATFMSIAAETVTSAVVPVEIVTDGLVPGVPERVGVKVFEVVVPELVV